MAYFMNKEGYRLSYRTLSTILNHSFTLTYNGNIFSPPRAILTGDEFGHIILLSLIYYHYIVHNMSIHKVFPPPY